MGQRTGMAGVDGHERNGTRLSPGHGAGNMGAGAGREQWGHSARLAEGAARTAIAAGGMWPQAAQGACFLENKPGITIL